MARHFVYDEDTFFRSISISPFMLFSYTQSVILSRCRTRMHLLDYFVMRSIRLDDQNVNFQTIVHVCVGREIFSSMKYLTGKICPTMFVLGTLNCSVWVYKRWRKMNGNVWQILLWRISNHPNACNIILLA